jgi:hypothetical protein
MDRVYGKFFKNLMGMLSSAAKGFAEIEIGSRVKWVPVTTAWRVLRLRREEQPPVM